jgi:hypothetical protein
VRSGTFSAAVHGRLRIRWRASGHIPLGGSRAAGRAFCVRRRMFRPGFDPATPRKSGSCIEDDKPPNQRKTVQENPHTNLRNARKIDEAGL